jgi:DNA (cytosine-5)-methyltransferase 1
MLKPRLLDLFCGAGGAAAGYDLAGFNVTGVDIVDQPRYPFRFLKLDALDVLEVAAHEDVELAADVIHASPPCQAFTAYRRNAGRVGDYPDLIARTREFLERLDRPYIIENVVGAPLRDPVLLCGSMFDETLDIRRHRLFETNWTLEPPVWPCRHKLQAAERFQASSNRRPQSRRTLEVGSWDEPLARQQAAMGIDWMTLEELSEAIPPAYTAFIGARLIDQLVPTSQEAI